MTRLLVCFFLFLLQIEEEEGDDSLDISISVSDPEKIGECTRIYSPLAAFTFCSSFGEFSLFRGITAVCCAPECFGRAGNTLTSSTSLSSLASIRSSILFYSSMLTMFRHDKFLKGSHDCACLPGDGMNAYMAYKVTTKVREHGWCLVLPCRVKGISGT